MNAKPFVLLYDYRCPFARNLHEHLLTALDAGLRVDVTFEPYTLSQGHIEPGDPAVWDDPSQDAALLALEVSVAVRDQFPEQFSRLHGAFFHARHVDAVPLTTREQITPILEAVGLDAEAVYKIVDSKEPREKIARSWTHYHDDLDVFGVPTFIFDDNDATFVRLMHGPNLEIPQDSVTVIERVIDLVSNQVDINELKHTQVAR